MKKKIIILLALVLAGPLSLLSTVSAVDETGSIRKDCTDRGYLLITPGHFKYGLLEPGSSYTETFTAINSCETGGEALTFNLTVEPYWVSGETYEPVFSGQTNRTKLSEWVTFPDGTEYTLEPTEQVEIRVRVKVPNNAVGGGQYAAVMANIVPTKDNTTSINAQARIAILLHSTINGEVEYRGRLISQSITGFTFDPSIKTSSVVENTGNADFEATYRLKISPFFDEEEIVYETAHTKLILPETKRIFEQSWDEAPALGIFRVNQEIDYVDENGEQTTISYSQISIICPLWLILLIVLIITMIVIAVIMKKKQRSKKDSKKPSWEQE